MYMCRCGVLGCKLTIASAERTAGIARNQDYPLTPCGSRSHFPTLETVVTYPRLIGRDGDEAAGIETLVATIFKNQLIS